MKDAPIIVPDEATANAEPENKAELMQQDGIYRSFAESRQEAASRRL